METLAAQALSALDPDDLGGFWMMSVLFAIVCGGIPAFLVEARGGPRARNVVRALAALHGMVLVLAPAVLLMPVIREWPRLAIFPVLVFGSLLFLRMQSLFAGGVGNAVAVSLAPWLAVAVGAFVQGSSGGLGADLADAAQQVGRIAFASFWLSFPFWILGRTLLGEGRTRGWVRTAGLLGVLYVVALPGIWMALHAWAAAEPAGAIPDHRLLGAPVFLPWRGEHWAMSLGAVAQAVLEGVSMTRSYQHGLEGTEPADRRATRA